MKLFPTHTPYTEIDNDRCMGVLMFGYIVFGLSLGDIDHWGIIILGRFVGFVYWTDSQWEQFLLDDR